MKKDEIKVGGTYLVKVSDRVVPVRIDAESAHGGWDATNLRTQKPVRIKGARRLRCPVNRDEPTQAKPKVQTPADTAKQTPKAQPKPEVKATTVAPTMPKKLSCLDAAAKVLGETGQAMTC